MKVQRLLCDSCVGAGGTTFTVLCNMGSPLLLAFLTAIGLGFLIDHRLLVFLTVFFLAIGLAGTWLQRKKNWAPFTLMAAGSVSVLVGTFYSERLAVWGLVFVLIAAIWDLTHRHFLK